MGATFNLTREGARLRITIADSRTGSAFVFDNASAGSAEWAAMLLLDRLTADFADQIEKTRRAAYEGGWSDAKAKRPKRNWFCACINNAWKGGPQE